MEKPKLAPVFCPIVDGACTEEQCPLWMILDDWQGCTMAGAQDWLQQIIEDGAKALDAILGLRSRGPPDDDSKG